ncbi:GNAT family N-acetyltransferase [Radiobacillus kanasensis]|uniref:GNAT family N-acetyltransferase n=1 Tax=Radiobacillus kanasensis TaxID=2844358 RepID=UPI001E41B67C|nr:GNAT family N-acetyltransferase [Radiobacillus kanasensis]UFT99087.1 GNAT family N-acetyltransferase [Radiobacillus kanasensis]
MNIRKLEDRQEAPMSLLLLADPAVDLIQNYLEAGDCYVAEKDGVTIGAYVLLQTGEGRAEIVNVAVAEGEQGKGIGKELVMHAIGEARKNGYRELEVCTGNSSIGPFALYQKCGFRIDSIDQDYFVRNYSEPIYEHGIVCRDRIRLRLPL